MFEKPENPDVSIIIVSWNTCDLLAACLESVDKEANIPDIEVLVVDNASTDGSLAMLKREYPQVRVIANLNNLGFSKANNQGLAACRGRYALLLNSDALLTQGSLQGLLHLANEKPRAGIVGAQLLNPDGSFQASHTSFPNLWQEFLILSGLGRRIFGRWYPSHASEEEKGPQIVDYVEGACLLVRREAFEDVGGLDEGYFMYAEEVDWCYTMREHGWQVWYQPVSKVIHLGGGSSQERRTKREGDLYRSRVRFFRKHYGDGPAHLLKLQLYFMTAIKVVLYGFLRRICGGRYGREVISLRHLAIQLRGV